MSAFMSMVGVLNRRIAYAFSSGILGSADSGNNPSFPDTGFLVDSAANFLVTSDGSNIRYAQL